VDLTDLTPRLFAVHLDALAGVTPAAKLTDSDSLEEAEAVVRDLTGISELRYEAAKAAKRSQETPTSPSQTTLAQVDTISGAAAQRGSSYISMRRLSELVNCTSLDTFAQLHRLLAEHRPDRHVVAAYRVDGPS
jgi:hypothetical protein